MPRAISVSGYETDFAAIFTRSQYCSFSPRLRVGHFRHLALRITLAMFSRFQAPVSAIARQFSTTQAAQRSVAVMGASGGEAERLMT